LDVQAPKSTKLLDSKQLHARTALSWHKLQGRSPKASGRSKSVAASPCLEYAVGKAYITHADPKMGTRTWQAEVQSVGAKSNVFLQALEGV
jgi:hypothetical protein